MENNITFSFTVHNNNATNAVFLNQEKQTKFANDFLASIGDGDVFIMARAFLSISSMTNKKLQKLCYYAKAWYLALYDQNIIADDFEAWVHGAVQPALYHTYKRYGFSQIPREMNRIGIPEEFLSFAQEIYDSYGHLSGDELEAINHTEMPWLKAREGLKPWENCRVVISEEDMKIYYRKMM